MPLSMLSNPYLLVCVALAAIAAFLWWRLLQLKQAMRVVAEVCADCAQGDMEQRIILPKASGEILLLMNNANRFIDVADAYIRESGASADHAARGLFYRNILPSGLNGTWKSAAEQLNQSSRQVRENLVKTVNDAGKKLEASVMQTILQLSGSTQQLMGTSDSLNQIASHGSEEAEALAVSTTATAENMNTIAAAVEEMTAAVREISKQLSHTNTLSQEAAVEGEATRAVLVNLVASSQRIGEIAELINTIASQVNLLALNATIEAARAGDAGKGFAVVASEVKNLATRTTAATAQVEEYIAQTRVEVDRTSQALSSILSKMGALNQASCVIASAVEEQSATTLEISNNLQKTSQTMQQFSHSVDLMAESSGKTKSVAEEMHQSSTTLAKASDTLKADIQHFLKSLESA